MDMLHSHRLGLVGQGQEGPGVGLPGIASSVILTHEEPVIPVHLDLPGYGAGVWEDRQVFDAVICHHPPGDRVFLFSDF